MKTLFFMFFFWGVIESEIFHLMISESQKKLDSRIDDRAQSKIFNPHFRIFCRIFKQNPKM